MKPRSKRRCSFAPCCHRRGASADAQHHSEGSFSRIALLASEARNKAALLQGILENPAILWASAFRANDYRDIR